MARRRSTGRGFTLIEAALATIIIGVGVVSMMQLLGSLTQGNSAAGELTTAMYLADNIQETMAHLSFDDPIYGASHFGPEPGETLATCNDVDDFDGSSFNPPIDAMRQAIPALSQYTQTVSVLPVYPTQLSVNTNESSPSPAKGTYTGAARVRVHVYYQATATSPKVLVYTNSWIRMDH